MMKKKGQIDGIVSIGYGLIVLAILIGVGLVVLQNFSTASKQKNVVGAAVNETNPVPTGAGITLVAGGMADGVCGAITGISNGSSGNGLTIVVANVTQNGCFITNATSDLVLPYTSTIRYTYPYTYTANTTATTTTGTLMTYLGTGSGGLVTWVPAIIALVIGMYFIGAFGGSKGRKV